MSIINTLNYYNLPLVFFSSIPFILFKYGSIIRNKSKFAGTVAAKEQILESDDDSEKVKV